MELYNKTPFEATNLVYSIACNGLQVNRPLITPHTSCAFLPSLRGVPIAIVDDAAISN